MAAQGAPPPPPSSQPALPSLPRECLLYTLSPPPPPPPPPSGANTRDTAAGGTAKHHHHPSYVALVDLHNPNPVQPLLTLRSPVPHPCPHSLSTSRSSPSLAGLVVHADAQKPLLAFHTFQNESLAHRLVCPEAVSCLALSPASATYLVAGARDSGHAYLWHLASGRLEASWEAHYRGIDVVRWTCDALAFVTAARDSRVCVWSLAGTLDPASSLSDPLLSNPDELQPRHYAVLTDHALPVTDLALSPNAGFLSGRARLYTSSLDCTVKVWDLRSRRLLSTFVFPTPIHAVCLDATERFFYAAGRAATATTTSAAAVAGEEASQPASSATTSAGGVVYRVDLFRRPKPTSSSSAAAGGPTWEARGGGGASGHVERVADAAALGAGEGAKSDSKYLIRTPSPPTSLCLSETSSMLLVGLANSTLLYLDIATGQTLRSLSLFPSHAAAANAANAAPTPASTSSKRTWGGVTNLVAMPRPLDLLPRGSGSSTHAEPSSSSHSQAPMTPVPRSVAQSLSRVVKGTATGASGDAATTVVGEEGDKEEGGGPNGQGSVSVRLEQIEVLKVWRKLHLGSPGAVTPPPWCSVSSRRSLRSLLLTASSAPSAASAPRAGKDDAGGERAARTAAESHRRLLAAFGVGTIASTPGDDAGVAAGAGQNTAASAAAAAEAEGEGPLASLRRDNARLRAELKRSRALASEVWEELVVRGARAAADYSALGAGEGKRAREEGKGSSGEDEAPDEGEEGEEEGEDEEEGEGEEGGKEDDEDAEDESVEEGQAREDRGGGQDDEKIRAHRDGAKGRAAAASAKKRARR